MTSANTISDYKLFRYIVSGATAAFVYLAVLYVLTDIAGIWYLFSTSAGFAVAFAVSFMLQKLWTFGDARLHVMGRQALLYLATALGGLAFNAAVMYALVDGLRLWYMLAQVISSGFLALISFFIYAVIFAGTGENRILVATGLYPPDIGGPATYSRLLEEALPKEGVAVRVLPFKAVRGLPKLVRHVIYFALACFEAADARIILALDPVSVGLPALCAAKILRKRFIVKVAGDYAWEQFQVKNEKSKAKNRNPVTPDEFQGKRFDFLTETRRRIEQFVARRADEVIVPSEYLKKIVLRWGVPEEKIKVIYNSFDAPDFHGDRNAIRERLGMDGTVLLSAGRLVPWKGFGTLIDAFAVLRKNNPHTSLYIAGDGPERPLLKEKISGYGLQNRVHLLGVLPHETLMEYIRAADMFVLNTGYEGFSHQLLEVIALGTPVVTTDVGGNPELIENQKEGLLVPYNDAEAMRNAIHSLVSDDELRRRLAENGKKKASLFSKGRMVHALMNELQ